MEVEELQNRIRAFPHFNVVPLQRETLDHCILRLQRRVLEGLGVVALHPQLFNDLFGGVHLNRLWLGQPDLRHVPKIVCRIFKA